MESNEKKPVDTDLIVRFQQGDHAAVHTLLELYGRRLQAFLRQFVRSEELAEDIAQDVFVMAYTKRESLLNPAKFEAWIFRMAKNAAINEMKKKRHKVESAMDQEIMEGMIGCETSPWEGLQEERAGNRLDEALKCLDEKRRTIMALRYFSGLSLKEIADVMDIPMGSVGTTIVRALEQMRKHLEAKGLRAEDLLP